MQLPAVLSALGFFVFGRCLISPTHAQRTSPVADQYFHHSEAQRINTDAVIFRLLVEQHPDLEVTVVPVRSCNLFAYAAAGLASTVASTGDASLNWYEWREYQSAERRFNGDNGSLINDVKFGIYSYLWQDTQFTLYVVDGRDGSDYYGQVTNQYLIGPRAVADDLILAAGHYGVTLHNEIWVFDRGYWSKNAGLWAAMNKSSWDNVILDDGMKSDLAGSVLRFFDSQDEYARLGVPWKRGIIFHGPPGNGKTISIKATMHTLYSRTPAVPTLYVKTLSGYGEYALSEIFNRARAQAPCYLVFEDLDSLVTDDLRSYFLNQVDGIEENDGILMVGSTNHLERLDPGIAKRPSRFDRKFFFPNPNLAQRKQYCAYWREKLAGNKDIEFPVELVDAVANITDGFSFAYIQEAFVASLLLIAGDGDVAGGRGIFTTQDLFVLEDKLERLRLWRVIREQVKELRRELETEREIIAEVGNDAEDRAGRGFGLNKVPLGRVAGGSSPVLERYVNEGRLIKL